MNEGSTSNSKWGSRHDWEIVLPPSRPSPYQLDVIRDILDTVSTDLPIGILGATPEFRDLATSLGFENVYVFEKNLQFHSHVRSERVYDNSEQLVHGEWLETLPGFSDRFAVILSDLTSGNVPYDEHRRFYRLIADALRDDGRFVDKVLKNDAPPQTLDTLDEKYKQSSFNLRTLNRFHCEYFFTSELPYERGVVDVDGFYMTLNERFEHPTLRKLLAENKRLAPPGSVWYYGRSWESIRERYFDSLERLTTHPEPEGSPYHRRAGTLISEPE